MWGLSLCSSVLAMSLPFVVSHAGDWVSSHGSVPPTLLDVAFSLTSCGSSLLSVLRSSSEFVLIPAVFVSVSVGRGELRILLAHQVSS